MWFSRSSGRKHGKGQQEYPPTTSSPVKPLLNNEENYTLSRSRDSSPTKARLVETPSSFSTIHGQGQRPEFSRSITTPVFGSPPPDALNLLDSGAPSAPRLSISSSNAGNRDAPSSPTVGASNRFLHPGGFLQPPPSARSLRNPSYTNLIGEDEAEGGDRLFDAFTGRPLATMNPMRGGGADALPTIHQIGSDLEVIGPSNGAAGGGHKHRGSGEMEDPARVQMWEYLSKIRTLQAEVAALHFAMDGQALGDPWGAARTGGRSRSGSVNNLNKDARAGFVEKNSSAPKVAIPTEPLLVRSKTRGGSNDSDEERGEDKKAKIEEDFQALDKMYEDKQDVLTSVTTKLKELASAVRAYHELENPIINPTSRHNTLESHGHVFYDSPAAISTSNSSPVKKPITIESSRAVPRLSLAPILTASPSSSLPPSPLSKPHNHQTQVPPRARRTSLEMGAGGGPHHYTPISPGTPGPQAFPLPPQSPKR
ncbi:SubName: Full=Uncharacterized protein {ECO:0000313/EMBL:CCA68990.1} [Serendipita indica DSM 11827]|uniref:Uncharacterized protein n=1 Tax=Serendipita indica (strain DSM 11827) TaxID=1109443 RepID=G4TCD6_SERID|nr:SubName: Full=Uncharacterized protein {ECO:0000313/EMBL:CCA68990.1} [Serendipita indica DSM 11827]CCA68990.1 hypothetical protein PIIN_02850 [Serendipita indica DSM 11827]